MTEPLVVRFYLPKDIRNGIIAGQRIFYSQLISVLETAGYRVEFHADSLRELLKANARRGYSVFLMQEPVNQYGVTVRQNYFFPFWNIQQKAKRWEWPVALTDFDPESISPKRADRFFNFWRGKRFGSEPQSTSKEGFVFVPLQGRLLAHRSFQYCSPIEMLKKILEYDRDRKVVATFHPREVYSIREREALQDLERRHTRLELSDKPAEIFLKSCDYVATQNSSVALSGFFFRKPAVLFGQIDFHHIASCVHLLGAKVAIQNAPELTPSYEKYLWWFFRHMSIHVLKPDAEAKIRTALVRAGWPV